MNEPKSAASAQQLVAVQQELVRVQELNAQLLERFRTLELAHVEATRYTVRLELERTLLLAKVQHQRADLLTVRSVVQRLRARLFPHPTHPQQLN